MNCRCKQENLVVYEMLRNNILSCEDRLATQSINMYLIYFTVLAMGASFNDKLLLVTFVVLIIFQSMINSTRRAIEKASAYIWIFFERTRDDIHWETLHRNGTHLSAYNSQNRTIGWYITKAGAVCLAFVSLFFIVYKKLSSLNIGTDTLISQIGKLLDTEVVLAVVLFVIVVYMNRKMFVSSSNNLVTQSIEWFYKEVYSDNRSMEDKNVAISMCPCLMIQETDVDSATQVLSEAAKVTMSTH